MDPGPDLSTDQGLGHWPWPLDQGRPGEIVGEILARGTVPAVEVAHRGLTIVPEKKMPYDFFVIAIAEVMIRAGEKAEGEKLIDDVLTYSSGYLGYADSLTPERRFGLDYPIGINMQALIDIYRMSIRLGMKDLTNKVEPQLNKYYSELYSGKR